MVNVETNHGALDVEVDIEATGDLPGLDARHAPELDIKAVGLRVVVELHSSAATLPSCVDIISATWLKVPRTLQTDPPTEMNMETRDQMVKAAASRGKYSALYAHLQTVRRVSEWRVSFWRTRGNPRVFIACFSPSPPTLVVQRDERRWP